MKKNIRLKLISTVLVVTLFCALFSVSAGATPDILPVVYGDVNCDGSIEIIDATLIQRALANLNTLNPISLEAADYDRDGKMTILDATWIQRKLARFEIPENYGGKFSYISRANNFYANYGSGKAMVGTPVVFTAEGGYNTYYPSVPSTFYAPKYKYIISRWSKDTNKNIILAESEWSEEPTFTYTFQEAGNYTIEAMIKDRFDNESSYSCQYKVVEPYTIEGPMITAVRGDKTTHVNLLSYDTITPSERWMDLTIYTIATGGEGDYEYRYQMYNGKDFIIQDYSSDNSFFISSDNFPEGRYDWENVTPYLITISVKDSAGNITTTNVKLTGPYDHDYIGGY